MDTKRLRYFCSIVEQKQISRAARVLHISQPPLSRYLKDLEESLGVTLIMRENNQWELTAAGALLYSRAKRVLDELESLEREVKDSANAVQGEIILGVSTTQEAAILEKLPGLHTTWPNIRLRLLVMDSSLVEKGLCDGSVDVGVVLLPVDITILDTYPLPEERYLVVAPKGYLAQTPQKNGLGPALTLDDVAALPLLLSRRWTGAGAYDIMLRHWQQKGKKANIILDSHNVSSLVRLIDLGMPGVSIVPESAVPQDFYRRLDVCPLASEELCLYPVIAHRKGKFISRAMRETLTALLCTPV